MKVSVHAKLKNAILFAAAAKLGGQSELARQVGVTPQTMASWCNLKGWPPVTDSEVERAVRWGSQWTKARRDALEAKLFELTGKLLDEIFPEELRQSDLKNRNLQITKTADIPVAAIQTWMPRGLLPSPEEIVEGKESQEAAREILNQALSTLTWREREVAKLRWGLEDGSRYTLEEVAHIFKVTKERIRQVEGKADRKVKQWIAKNKPRALAGVAGFDDADECEPVYNTDTWELTLRPKAIA